MNESEKQGFFAKRSNKLLVLIVASFLALVAATVGAMEYTSTTGFCNSCHIMNPSYNAWASSSHKGVHCYECHMDEGTINYLKAKVNGLKEVYLTVTKSVTTTGTDEEAWDKCQKCHANLYEPPKEQVESFDHYKHISKDISCKQCHGNLIHGEENKDFKQVCADCHQNKVAVPASHSKPEFKVTHGQEYLKNKNSCTLCHSEGKAQQMCLNCHGLAMPHPADFVQKHAADAGQADCQKCHLDKPDNLPRKAQSCQTCHSQSKHPQDYLTGHGKVVKEQGDKTCLNCHKEQPAGQKSIARSCNSCHGIQMPHPTNFTSQHAATVKTSGSQVCVNCHKNDEKPRSAQTCQECHGVALPHPNNYLVKHPDTVAAKGTKDCLKCHDNSSSTTVSCQKCHGLPMPHPAGYTAQHTTVVAAQGTQVCLNCHKTDGLARQAKTCVSCHGLPMPHAGNYITQHMADAKAKGTASCIKCHSGEKGYKAPTCNSCHGVQMPHPADWQSTHGKSGNLQSCTSCHSKSNRANPNASWAKDTFCTDCHQNKPHEDNFLLGHTQKDNDVTTCTKCHDFATTCAKCHQS